MNGPFSPRCPRTLTRVYAMPAKSPPKTPITEGKNAPDMANPGLTTRIAPKKAMETALAWIGEIFSFNIK